MGVGDGVWTHWKYHGAQGSVHAGVTVVAAPSGIAPTESMLPQHTDSVPHEFGGAKRERLLDKVSATSIRTAEVTIWTARSPSETQVVEDDIHGVIAQSIECSAHGSPPRHSYRASRHDDR